MWEFCPFIMPNQVLDAYGFPLPYDHKLAPLCNYNRMIKWRYNLLSQTLSRVLIISCIHLLKKFVNISGSIRMTGNLSTYCMNCKVYWRREREFILIWCFKGHKLWKEFWPRKIRCLLKLILVRPFLNKMDYLRTQKDIDKIHTVGVNQMASFSKYSNISGRNEMTLLRW